jgi:hypothetical protein
MNFTKRVAKLEQLMVPKRQARVVLRYEGPGSERFLRSTQKEMDGNRVVVLRFVEARNGRAVRVLQLSEKPVATGKRVSSR